MFGLIAEKTKNTLETKCEDYLKNFDKETIENSKEFKLTEQYLDSVQYDIMKIAIKKELEK